MVWGKAAVVCAKYRWVLRTMKWPQDLCVGMLIAMQSFRIPCGVQPYPLSSKTCHLLCSCSKISWRNAWSSSLPVSQPLVNHSFVVLSHFLQGHFVDVVDSARIHLAALLFPDVKNERVFAVNAPYNASTLRYFLQALYPDKPLQGERELQDLSEDLTVFREAGRAEALLRRMGRLGWTNIQDSIARSCEGF